jgi:hypothetical protein
VKARERRILARVAIFVGILLLAGWPWGFVRVGFSQSFSALANPVFRQVRFDRGILLQLLPLPPGAVRQPGDNVEADTHIVLRVPGTQAGGARMGMSLRRDAYLPLLLFVALTLVLPLRGRDKARCLAAGVPAVLVVAMASIAIAITFMLSTREGSMIPGWQREVSTFLFDCWLTPPGNRVIAPVIFALALAAYAARRPSSQNAALPSEADDTESLQTRKERHA